MKIGKTSFEDRKEGTFAVWDTPYGHQEINLSIRSFKVSEGKIKVELGGIEESVFKADTERVVDLKDYSFRFKGVKFTLIQSEIDEVVRLLSAAKEEKEKIKEERVAQAKKNREARERWLNSDEYKERLLKELERVRNREKEILRDLKKFGYQEEK